MSMFITAAGSFFVVVLSFVLLCAPRDVSRVGIFFGGGRGFGMSCGVAGIVCLAAQALAWAYYPRGEIYGVRPVVFFGLYCVCAFCLRGIYLWYAQAGKRGG